MAKRYKVKRGEDLVSIAAKFGTTPQSLMNLNKVRTVSTGVGLKIPTTSGAGQGRLNAPMYTPSQQRALGVGAKSTNFSSSMNKPYQPSFLENLKNSLIGGYDWGQGPQNVPAAGGSSIRGYAPKVQAAPKQFLGQGIRGAAGQGTGFNFGQNAYMRGGYSGPITFNERLQQQGPTITETFGMEAPGSASIWTPPTVSGAGYGRQNAPMLTPAQQLLRSQPTYAGTVHPNQVFDPKSGQWISTQPQATEQLQGFDINQGGSYVEEGIVGDKWEVAYIDGQKVTRRAGRRRGKGGRARRLGLNAQQTQVQSPQTVGDVGQIASGVWRIGF